MSDDAKRHRPGGGPTCGDYGHKNKRGQKCGQYVVKGTKHCRHHAGKTLAKAKAQGAVVVELKKWGLGDSTVDPGEVLLRLVTQSAWRAERYAAEVARLVEEASNLTAALTGSSYTVDEEGEAVKSGEYIRAMVELENDERDRCAGFAAKAIAAGLAERQMQVLERQVEIFAAALRAGLSEAGMNEQQQQDVIGRVGRHLRLAAG